VLVLWAGRFRDFLRNYCTRAMTSDRRRPRVLRRLFHLSLCAVFIKDAGDAAVLLLLRTGDLIMLKYKYIFQIKYTEAILSNSTRKLLWFEISKTPIAV